MHPFRYLFYHYRTTFIITTMETYYMHYHTSFRKYCREFVLCQAIMEIIFNAVNNLGFLLFTVAIQVVRIDISHSIEVMLKHLLFYSRYFAFHSPFPFNIQFNIQMIVKRLMVRLES